MNIRDLVRMAMYLAIFAVLDYIAVTSGLFAMPQGGTIGLATIVLVVASYDFNLKNALFVAMLSVVVQLFISTLYFVAWPQLFLDYIFAFGIYAFAAKFPTYKGKTFWLSSGVIVVNVLRFIGHVISGVLYFEVPLLGSITYNIGYMGATLVVSFLIVGLLLPRLHLQLKRK
mgnify:CR=1 FL=1